MEKNGQATSDKNGSDKAEAKSVKGLLSDFAEGTSMHGLGRVVTSRFLWLRLLWALLVLGGAGVAAYNVINIILLFFDYPVSTVVSLKYSPQIPFPAVTICNLNLLRKTQLEQNVKLQGLQANEQQAVGDSTTQTPTGSTANYTANNTEIYDLDEFNPETAAMEEYKIRLFLASVDRESRRVFGHQLDDMLVSCAFQSVTCQAHNFTELYNREFGNCYTFNKDGIASSVSKSGPVQGLKLILNVESDEYAQTSDTVGFKVVIHPPDYMPFPEDEGVMVSAGFTTNIAVNRLDIERTGSPYGRCGNYEKNTHRHLNMYSSYFDVGYSDKACQRTCFQRAMYDKCTCCNRDYFCYITDSNGVVMDVNFCNYSNYIEEYCSRQVETQFEEGTLECEDQCIPACHETSYTSEVSSAKWPSPSREDITVAFMASHRSTNGKIIGPDYVRNNVAQVNVYFKQLNYEKITTSPAYDWSRLVSDLGGQFGLWLGFSLLTAVEFVQLVFDICHHLGARLCCGGRQRSTSRVQVLSDPRS